MKSGRSVTHPCATPEFELAADLAEFFRKDISDKLDPKTRVDMGQFMTDSTVAGFMANMFSTEEPSISLLDAGAGAGALTAAFVSNVCARANRPKTLTVTAFELDPMLASKLECTLDSCKRQCDRAGIEFSWHIFREDFIEVGVSALRGSLVDPRTVGPFTCAILNPPYRKINSNSRTRQLLRSIGMETSNLYTGFLTIATGLLESGGELVAITPRSFCNGPYFFPFRKRFLHQMTFRRLHVFESRSSAFSDDDVLQENIIFRAVKMPTPKNAQVIVSSSNGPQDSAITMNELDYDQLVKPEDPDMFIRIVKDWVDESIGLKMESLSTSLTDLGLAVSTGKVVDFRAKDFLRYDPYVPGTVPLIYPCHFEKGYVAWPNGCTNKANAIVQSPDTESLLVPDGTYVLVKRFSSKEETRRIVAALYSPDRVTAEAVGLENHLNYFHCNGKGLPEKLARGLAMYLNSTLVDVFFRQFNGHTQVNATDLRSLKYPTRSQLEDLGARLWDVLPEQGEIDSLIEQCVFTRSSPPEYPRRVRVRDRQPATARLAGAQAG